MRSSLIVWFRFTSALLLVLISVISFADTPLAGILAAGLPGEDPALITAIEGQLRQAGYEVKRLDAADICNATILTPQTFSLLALPDASTLPVDSAQPIDTYLREGGNLLALRAPLWQQMVVMVNGRWMKVQEYQRDQARRLPEHILVDFTPDDITSWQRSTNHQEFSTKYETVADGPSAGQRALHVTIDNLEGWDTFHSPDQFSPFAGDRTLTVFSAKGDDRTSSLAIEWTEHDGSRWIAVVPLSQEWRQYVLRPEDFRFWQSNPARGGNGDRFNPANAASVSIGLAYSHTGATPGPHEYWIGPFGTARASEEYTLLDTQLPALDTIAPDYKYFPVTGAKQLVVRNDQCIVSATALPLPSCMRSAQPRPRGAGFAKDRSWRFIPLLEARTATGEWRGTPATLLFNTDGPYRGGIWATFGVQDLSWYKAPAVLNLIRQVATRMRNDAFLLDGGANYYTYFTDQEVKLGLRVVAVHSNTMLPEMKGRIIVTDAATGKPIFRHEWPLRVTATPQNVSLTWKPQAWPPQGYRVTAMLVNGESIIDSVTHQITAWQPNAKKEFVTIANGDFMWQGRQWRIHGVNYMPSSGIGTEYPEYFEKWLSAPSYDPEIIERDLQHIKAMGLNAVSIFLYRDSMEAQNLLDLLARLERLGLKANLSLRPGTPMDFPAQSVKEMIEYYRLAQNDTVYAYDLAWEPMFGGQDGRKSWDGAWARWVIERYGSLADAERDWGVPMPRDATGNITNPSAAQLGDMKYIRLNAAYRRFLDTLVYTKYSEARRFVHSIDPHHFVSFRMAEAGNPTFNTTEMIPYDFPYLAGAVDFLAPEGYGRPGIEWDTIKPGVFEFAYARWADAAKPMVWAEMGTSVCDSSTREAPTTRLDFAAEHYRLFYRMMNASGADGIFYWWYPGGYRVNEQSDYGIINPDGSDRPVTKVIRENAASFLAWHGSKPVDTWLEFDRDEHPLGITGTYTSLKDTFWQAIDRRLTPGLKTAGTGTTSVNCPLLAVGNTPINGHNPPKYLDGIFDVIEVQDAGGQWQRVENGGGVQVAAGHPVMARASITNLGEAQWMAGNSIGAVSMTINGSECISLSSPLTRFASWQIQSIPLAPTGITKNTDIVLSFSAKGRVEFGERFTIHLLVK